jgi:hypothetical protein
MPAFRRDEPADLPFLYIDAETIPSRDPAVFDEIAEKHLHPANNAVLPEIRPAANLRDPIKIQQDIEARKLRAQADLEERIRKAEDAFSEAVKATALSTCDAHVVSLALAVGEGEVVAAHVGQFIDTSNEVIDIRNLGFECLVRAEERLLEAFWGAISDAAGESRSAIPVGHNIIGFDLPLLRQRSIILGVRPPTWWPVDPAPWSKDAVDTMVAFSGKNGRIGLKRLAAKLRIPVPPTKGSDVAGLVASGRLDLVSYYNGDDVRLVRSVHRRIQFLDPLSSDIEALRISTGLVQSSAASDILSTVADAGTEPHPAHSVENEPVSAQAAPPADLSTPPDSDPLDDLLATVPTPAAA